MSAPAAPAPAISLNEAQQQTYDLITRNLQEVLGEDIIKSKLAKDEIVSCYWGERSCIVAGVSSWAL